SPETLEIAIGPGAQRCCYEVDRKLATRFSRALQLLCVEGNGNSRSSAAAIEQRGEKFFLCISALLEEQAVSEGVPRRSIARSSLCSICDLRFFSYRREKNFAGRQLSMLGGSRNMIR